MTTYSDLAPASVTVVALDDNADFLENGLLILEQEGFDLHRFTDAEEFTDFVRSHDGIVVALVDHDLGAELNGYDVVRRIREDRSDGLLLPVVYLTGRESESGFLEAEAANPYTAPSLYLSKRALGRVDIDLLVIRLARQSIEAGSTADDEAVERATVALASLPGDQLRSF